MRALKPIAVDFGSYDSSAGTTQFARNTKVQVTSFEQNGIPRGSFKDLAIDKSGFITLNYDNGRSKTFYQIPLVQFYAEDQLQRVTGGAYQRTIEVGHSALQRAWIGWRGHDCRFVFGRVKRRYCN